MEMGLKELRKEIAHVLKLVEKGEDVTITNRGRAIAVIRGLSGREEKLNFKPVGFGMWAGRKEMADVKRWMRKSRRARHGR